jgi:ATP-dependent RNA helicase DeaD
MKREVDRLLDYLSALGFNAKGLHGDMEQPERDEMIKGYRRGQIKIMVATDVASRGLDVKNVSHVFNYHIPFDPQSYVHRIGRTGRAGKSGQAITLVSTGEFRELQRIQKEVGAEMRLATIENGEGLSDAAAENLIEKIRSSAIHPDIDRIINGLVDMEVTSVLKKTVSLLLDREKSNTGERIGLDREMVDEMMENFKTEKRSERHSNRRRRRR